MSKLNEEKLNEAFKLQEKVPGFDIIHDDDGIELFFDKELFTKGAAWASVEQMKLVEGSGTKPSEWNPWRAQHLDTHWVYRASLDVDVPVTAVVKVNCESTTRNEYVKELGKKIHDDLYQMLVSEKIPSTPEGKSMVEACVKKNFDQYVNLGYLPKLATYDLTDIRIDGKSVFQKESEPMTSKNPAANSFVHETTKTRMYYLNFLSDDQYEELMKRAPEGTRASADYANAYYQKDCKGWKPMPRSAHCPSTPLRRLTHRQAVELKPARGIEPGQEFVGQGDFGGRLIGELANGRVAFVPSFGPAGRVFIIGPGYFDHVRLKDAPAPAPKFKVGDHVKRVDFADDGHGRVVVEVLKSGKVGYVHDLDRGKGFGGKDVVMWVHPDRLALVDQPAPKFVPVPAPKPAPAPFAQYGFYSDAPDIDRIFRENPGCNVVEVNGEIWVHRRCVQFVIKHFNLVDNRVANDTLDGHAHIVTGGSLEELVSAIRNRRHFSVKAYR